MNHIAGILAFIGLAVGLAAFGMGAVAAFTSASVNMSWNNPLPRAGCVFLSVGAALIALGIWGLRP